jgi:hypothetical protein
VVACIEETILTFTKQYELDVSLHACNITGEVRCRPPLTAQARLAELLPHIENSRYNQEEEEDFTFEN